MVSIIQPTFANGVISPSLYGRVDLASYYNSIKEGVNFIVRPYGGLDNRPGFKFIYPAKYTDKLCRLIDFQFSKDQTYVIELGDYYMRFYTRGGRITVSDTDSAAYEVATPYPASAIFGLKYTQSADVLTLVHEKYKPRQLKRYGERDWRLEEYVPKNGPFEDVNIDESVTVKSSGTTGTVTLTASNASIFSADMIGTSFYLEQPSVDTVTVWEISKTVAIGDERRAEYNYYKALTTGTTGSLRPSINEGAIWDGWGGSTGVQWQYLHSGSGIVRITAVSADKLTATATVVTTLPTVLTSKPTYKWARAVWRESNGYPSAVAYHKQRMFFAASTQYPQTVWATVIGDYTSFETSNETEDTDAITFTHASKQVNKIQHIIDIGSLIVLSSSGEYKIGTSNDAITPSTFSFNTQGAVGSSDIDPILVSDTALYVQNKNGIVRSIGYTFETDGFKSLDLTLFASHYFKNHSIIDWSFVNFPYSAAFCVRDDGVLLCLTYVRDQQVSGWTELSTLNGKFKSVQSISEGDEDVLYCVVERTINGETKTYIERMETRKVSNVSDYFFVDSGVRYDGRNTDSENKLSITEIDGLLTGDKVQVSFSVLTPDITNNNNALYVYYTEDGTRKILILSVVDADNLIFRLERDLPDALKTSTSDFGVAKSSFTGLDHLEGETVAIFGDGNVLATESVTDGGITLTDPCVVVNAGLPITSRIKTLSVNISGNETLLDKKKLITDVTLIVESTRGGFYGENIDNLYDLPQREFEFYDETINLATGPIDVKINSTWNKNGEFYIVQNDPLPMSILSIIPNVTVGGR